VLIYSHSIFLRVDNLKGTNVGITLIPNFMKIAYDTAADRVISPFLLL